LADAAPIFTSTGRRKTAVARVRLIHGNGTITVNGKRMESYFPREVLCIRVNGAFEAANVEGRFDVIAKVHGGGVAGQADALRHGIARALLKMDENLRPALKKNGMLTRDARKKERKKYGQKGARARFQFSKR